MSVINMLDAKSNLSRLVDAVESGREAEIIIARNGRPAAKLVALTAPSEGQRIGVAAGKFVMPDSIDDENGTIEALFAGRSE